MKTFFSIVLEYLRMTGETTETLFVLLMFFFFFPYFFVMEIKWPLGYLLALKNQNLNRDNKIILKSKKGFYIKTIY